MRTTPAPQANAANFALLDQGSPQSVPPLHQLRFRGREFSFNCGRLKAPGLEKRGGARFLIQLNPSFLEG
jgi:hypothetical protein